MRSTHHLLLVLLTTVALAGCTGPKGDTGPMGPSGTGGSPVYAYNQNYDGAGYLLSSEWTMNAAGGSGSISIDSTSFLSGGSSMKVTGGTTVNGVVFTNAGIVSYNSTNGAYTEDFYWNPAGIVTGTVKVEAVFVNGGTILADLGFAVGSPNIFYTYSGGVQHTLETVTSTPYFHHVQMVYHPATTYADYYIDDVLAGQSLIVGKTTAVSGPSGAWGGFLFPASLGTTPDVFYVDNYQIYHY